MESFLPTPIRRILAASDNQVLRGRVGSKGGFKSPPFGITLMTENQFEV